MPSTLSSFATLRTSRFQRIRLGAALVLIVLTGVVVPLASNGTIVALLLLALVTFAPGPGLRLLRETPPELAAGLALLAVWTVVSALWSPLEDPGKALRTVAIAVPGLVLVGWMRALPPPQRALLQRVLIATLALSAVLLLIEGLSDAWLTRTLRGDPVEEAANDLERVGRGVVLFAAVAWPAAVFLARRALPLGLAFAALALAAVVLLPMNAAILGTVLAALAFIAIGLAPRTALVTIGLAFCLYAAFAPAVSRDVVTIATLREAGVELPSAWAHRLGIWTFAAGQAAEHAPLGAGFDASRAIGAEGHVIEELRARLGYAPAALPLHPHNALLQIWLELGVAGVAAVCLLFVGLLRAVWRLRARRWEMAAAGAALVAALPPFVLNFGIWQAWWLASLWLGAGFVAGLTAERVRN